MIWSSLSCSRSIKSIILPARHRPFTINKSHQDHQKPAYGRFERLGLAKRVNARILPASTSEVYGDPKEHPQRSPTGDTSTQSVSAAVTTRKARCRVTLMGYHRQNRVDIRIARIFTLMARAWPSMTAASSATSLFRRFAISPSRSTAMALKPAPSVMSPTWWKVFIC